MAKGFTGTPKKTHSQYMDESLEGGMDWEAEGYANSRVAEDKRASVKRQNAIEKKRKASQAKKKKARKKAKAKESVDRGVYAMRAAGEIK